MLKPLFELNQCPECSYNLTLQFYPWLRPMVGKLPDKVNKIQTCPECNTKVTKDVMEEVSAPLIIYKMDKPLRMTSHPNGWLREDVVIATLTDEEVLKDLEDKGRAKCGLCSMIISMFLSYLVKLRNPAKYIKIIETIVETLPDGSQKIDKVEKFVPANPIKTRICQTCFNKFSVEDYRKDERGIANLEVLPDPKNMIRDGARHSVYKPQYIEDDRKTLDIEEKVYNPEDYGQLVESVLIGFDFDNLEADSVKREFHFVNHKGMPYAFQDDEPFKGKIWNGIERRKHPRIRVETGAETFRRVKLKQVIRER